MAKLFLRPDWKHDPDNIISATSEDGLGPGTSTPSSSNAGNLRLRQSGIPSSSMVLDVALQAGGNPYGYSLDDYGAGSGARIRWKNSTDGSTSWRGFSDSIYLHRVRTPLSFTATARNCSQLRQLPNGNLGWVTIQSPTTTHFRSMNSAGTVTSTLFGGDLAFFTYSAGPGLVVMPSGRLILLANYTGRYATAYSDDNGTTWGMLSEGALSGTALSSPSISMEEVDGMIVAVLSDASGGNVEIWTSRDGGVRFTLSSTTSLTGARVETCTTLDGRVLLVTRLAVQTAIYEVLPGGGLSDLVSAGAVGDRDEYHSIARRDDGTIWVAGWHISATRAMEMRLGVSIDNGATFADAAGSQDVVDTHDPPAATPITQVRSCFWRGRLVMLLQTDADTGSDNNLYLLEFGGWDTVTDVRTAIASLGQPYEHTYFPYDVPNAGAWAANLVGAGATITNQGPLNIVATVANNTYYSANGTFWTGASGDSKRIRFRCRVNSGGSTSADYAILRWHLTDGANCQQVKIQFASTGWRVTDGAGNVLATITAAMTGWCDILAFYQHESSANTGRVTIYYRLDSDTEGVWTSACSNAAVAESVGAGNQLYFGGTAAGVVDWDVLLLAVADDDCGFGEGFTNPTDLDGRPIPADTEVWVSNGLHIGGYSGAGVQGDSYTVRTLASYGKEKLWSELRPSCRVQSTTDTSDWAIVLDAGANNLWHVKDLVVFGTNARTIRFQMNATDAWGAPSVSQALTVDATSFVVGAANRGQGYVGPTTSPSWRPHQWRSDGDAHRWFAQVGDNVYEITDNDSSRLYIRDIDFSAASGTVYIFGDRGGYYHASTVNRYRFLRILIPTQDTADGAFRLGTVIAGTGYTPPQDYSWLHVDGVEPGIRVTVSDAGYTASARIGPRRRTLRIQWEALNASSTATGQTARQIEDLYAALEGEHTPVAFWRNTDDITTLGLYRVQGNLNRPNNLGELSDALGAIDPIELREEW